ncbi:polysaccharide pyruvyl transferase family protein [Ulvibacterium sp.]|uniref:polysaccharide pyruvyl transferase family protein n=1 Tax=Ulvibacterium sp. TaxID=2665914 RepID=UPI002625BB96|nr:polysaccharide pyruvyl transferase family protein [Ulvibacterium sp.]
MKQNQPKTIYIITFHHVLNYGAVLQAYALSRFLKENNYRTKIIDYRPVYFMYRTYRPAKGLLKSLQKVRKNIRFHRFRKNFLPLTTKVFFDIRMLEKGFKNVEGVFICGSDQIWNTQITGGKIDRGYFLDFLSSKNQKRIAYAASIGNTPFKNDDTNKIKTILNRFSKILMREDFGKKELGLITNDEIKSEIVVDPSLLIQDYNEILDFTLVPEQPYMISYLTEDSPSVRLYIKEIQERVQLPLINLGHHRIDWADKNYLIESPSKWLAVFSRASVVCTNSFHGTAYSLIFKRNFTVFSRETKKKLNRRQLTLLENLDLKGRFIYEVSDIREMHLLSIDYKDINYKYSSLISKSQKMLISAIEN